MRGVTALTSAEGSGAAAAADGVARRLDVNVTGCTRVEGPAEAPKPRGGGTPGGAVGTAPPLSTVVPYASDSTSLSKSSSSLMVDTGAAAAGAGSTARAWAM